MPAPNASQRDLIEGIDGPYLVDAGPGTGKTFTITRRYAEIVDQPGVEPEDVLLVTFTRNAATEMRDRIATHSDYGARALRDAPIGTFHSICTDVVDEGGVDAPAHLGLDGAITDATRVMADESLERERFREFLAGFADAHPEHHDWLRAVPDPDDIRDVIENLAAKGVFPTAEGWYRDGAATLAGDRETFEERFAALNRPRNGGNKQSTLRSRLGRYGRDACYLPDAPSKAAIRGESGSKAIPSSVADRVFDADRSALFAFVHTVYVDYLEFCLARDYLPFSFLQLFAFVHLCENDAVRERLAHEYVMIDEFQDTSEVQFKLALLLAGTTNCCVVGDWKQSIYGFQYADVENIRSFRARLDRFVADLNADRERVPDSFDEVCGIELERNYRSTQAIVDRSIDALTVPGSNGEDVDAAAIREQVVPLTAETDREHSRIEAIRAVEETEPQDESAALLGVDPEHRAILDRVADIVGNDDYAVRDDGELRSPTYGDIAIFSRTRAFGRAFLSAAEAAGVPVAYEGGVELFRTDPAKLLLAWLRICEGGADADRGWVVVLERAGYAFGEIRHVLETEDYPAAMAEFRDDLDAVETVGAVADRVCERYGCTGPVADLLRGTIQSVADEGSLSNGGLIRYVERGIEAGDTVDVTAAAGDDAITVQTIHAAKGLEYPIVICANVNRGAFPPSGRGGGRLVYDEGFGLRARKVYAAAHGQPHVYDDWRWDVLSACRPRDHDEERRLLYVAMTRARDHLLFTAGAEPSTFLEELPVAVAEVTPPRSIDVPERGRAVQTTFAPTIPDPEGPRGYSPHSLMDDAVFEAVETGRGPAYGTEVHDFAERYVLATADAADGVPQASRADVLDAAEPLDRDKRNVRDFVDSLDGELVAEKRVTLPLSVDDETVTLTGYVDLLCVTDEAVSIVDFKTDLGRHGQSEYRKQLSIYYRVLDAVYPDRDVTAQLFYTHEDESAEIDPLSLDRLRELVRAQLVA